MDETLPQLEETESISYRELPPDAQPKAGRDNTKVLLGIVIVLLVGVLVMQFVQLRAAHDVRAEVAALTEDVTDLKPLRRDVDILGDQVASLDGQVQAAVSAAGASPAAIPAQPADGSLPAFEDTANDPAVLGQMTLSEISGNEYYSAGNATFGPDDDKARVWMVWAHWCPYCQAELPDISTWYPENAARFPNVELVTITSAIDETRDNPLIPYLDAEQFPFPVLVDETGAVPPIKESHVETDAAWALYEAWLKIQSGQADVALVVAAASLCQGNLDLGAPLLEVDLQRNQRESHFIDFADQPVDLPPMKQQLAGTFWIVSAAGGETVWRDMSALQPHLTVPDIGVGVLELHLGIAQALDLGSTQDDAALKGIEDLVVVPGAAIGGNDLATRHQM